MSLLLIAQLSAITADVGEITAGSIRGVNVNASSHTTKGSYLTSAPSGGAATLNVRNTADFSSGGGSGWIIDTTNDRDAFTYTGKTAGTLTGCSGVLAHNNGATIIPQVKCIVIDGATNEVRFYGDRGDGVIEELGSIGIATAGPGVVVGHFGGVNSGNSRAGVLGESNSNNGIYGQSISAEGIVGATSTGGAGVRGLGTSTGAIGVFGTSAVDTGGRFDGNATRGNIYLPNCNGLTFPTDKAVFQIAQVGSRLYYSDGANWLPLTQPYFESSELTITVQLCARTRT